MSTPEEKKGEQEKARLNIMMALDMLQSAVGAFAPDTEEGQTIEKVVTEITAVLVSVSPILDNLYRLKSCR
jgi:hypothetical protein